MKALLSVYDKRGVVEFSSRLHAAGFELVSTGGTYEVLTREGKLPVQRVSDLTGFPEILDGRVKTLHPAIHGGLLARRDKAGHLAELVRHGISPIDLVAVNLYPFEATISRPDVDLETVLENIDIGGPALLRAAAKNYPFVTVVVDPEDYGWLAEKLVGKGLSLEERRSLAAKAFQHVALYDTLISGWLRGDDGPFSREMTLGLRKVADLRYGENPHQKGALYARIGATGGIVGAKHLHGRELSFNNILDADAAWSTVLEFPKPTAVVIKHTNPCGVASHPGLAEAYRRAYSGDPVSAYGGIVGFNRPVTGEAAEAMRSVFYEVVVAPGYEPEALDILQKKRDLRILTVEPARFLGGAPLDARWVSGGALFQQYDAAQEDPATWKVMTERQPTPKEMEQLAFAWKVVKHVKSNAIVLVKEKTLTGMGAGQPNRVTSVHLALRAAGEKAPGSVMASDAFFPFADGVELAVQGGIAAIVQPGGSIRDQEVIAAANKANVAMVFTGVRHFRH
ncbi:MAG: bifunctional phosphoribosylaminoimidazolecarboxamide formyltransferase/IMP cyclohydrolase [Chloroflexi bacterium]|nr:bifunctional phosphoribosylaminoimidazolecarboxamide formyltransferase/IMP cyclohydrolase [Chloroflexota bacterium]